MFRQSLNRPFRRNLMGNIPPALQQANRLMAAGRYLEAAVIFEQFANGAKARNGPRAPWFLLQAGQARLLGGQVPAGMAHIQEGLALFAARGQFQRVYHAGKRFEAELNARSLTAEAQRIEEYLKNTLPAGFTPGNFAGLGRPAPRLPVNCPSCGGPLHSNEVEWTDDVTAECPYCGSAVRG